MDLHENREEHWIPLSDLMTGLMMFFMLLAVSFMLKVQSDSQKIKKIAVLYDRTRSEIYRDLDREFKGDLPKWGAELEPDLTVRFKEPDILFNTGSADLKPKFKSILEAFFPRYIAILGSKKYRGVIQEIRIEGHTSSIWASQVSTDEAYFRNMELSQSRTRSTLQFVLERPEIIGDRKWIQSHLTANGLSSSRVIQNPNGTENFARSQRVEFRVRTDAEGKIATILEAAK
jgi:outer membrane protein OmpA-like peptidoglycan-associated protein